jgi:tetratricopeptide (TPR) repeat protein
MKPVAYYILSERSRLSEEEGVGVAFGIDVVYAKSHHIDYFDVVSDKPGQVPIYTSFPYDPAGDPAEQMNAYIRSQGRSCFLNDPERYEVFVMTSKEGTPAQSTCSALILDRGEPNRKHAISKELQFCLDRGRQWETLRRRGDAMHCYEIGLDVFGDHPELLLRLGVLKLEFETLLPGALACLRKAHDANPERTDALYYLALCYTRIAESGGIQVADTTPQRLKELALTLIEPVAAQAASDERILSLARKLKEELDNDTESFFRSGERK